MPMTRRSFWQVSCYDPELAVCSTIKVTAKPSDFIQVELKINLNLSLLGTNAIKSEASRIVLVGNYIFFPSRSFALYFITEVHWPKGLAFTHQRRNKKS